MNLQSLEEEIGYFNRHKGCADIIYNTKNKNFDCRIYLNDVMRVQEVWPLEWVSVYGKSDQDSKTKIGEKRKEYIIKLVELHEQGYEWDHAEDFLSEMWI